MLVVGFYHTRPKHKTRRSLDLSYTITSLWFLLSLFENRLHHFVSKLSRFGELRGEVLRNSLEAVPVGLEVPKGHTIGPGLDELVSGIETRQTYSCREDW